MKPRRSLPRQPLPTGPVAEARSSCARGPTPPWRSWSSSWLQSSCTGWSPIRSAGPPRRYGPWASASSWRRSGGGRGSGPRQVHQGPHWQHEDVCPFSRCRRYRRGPPGAGQGSRAGLHYVQWQARACRPGRPCAVPGRAGRSTGRSMSPRRRGLSGGQAEVKLFVFGRAVG
jgi:hypothetical protein